MNRWCFILAIILSCFAAPAWAACGDGDHDEGEQCDDGNTTAGDGCNEFCFLECGTFSTRLTNASFEFPGEAPGTWGLHHEDTVPGWWTTASDDLIEFWGTGHGGIDAYEGVNYIELNANEQSSIYTYIDTIPGTRIRWSIAHQARIDRREEIRVLIGTPGDMERQGNYDGRRGRWTVHEGEYEVPQGQYQTRIQFESRESGSLGNLIDSPKIEFVDVPDPYALDDCPENPTTDFNSTGRGRIQIAANGILSCDEAAAGCTDARDYLGGNVQNSQFDMRQIDADSDGSTFNSTSADLELNSGETVVWAQLYWMAGFTDFGKNAIDPPPNPAQRGTVRFKTPGGSYQDVTGSVEEIDGRFYQATADVTSLVNAGGEYWVANLQASQGRYMMGGWSLVVVTADDSLPVRSLTVVDSFQKHEGEMSFMIEDFAIAHDPGAIMEFGVVMYDGDANSTDMILLNGNVVTPATPTGLPYHAWDLANSSVSNLGYNVTTRTPSYPNNFGFDADIIDMSNATVGETDMEVKIRAPVGHDIIFSGVFTFQTDRDAMAPFALDGSRPLLDGSRAEPLSDGETIHALAAEPTPEVPESARPDNSAACSSTGSAVSSAPWWLLLTGLLLVRRRRTT